MGTKDYFHVPLGEDVPDEVDIKKNNEIDNGLLALDTTFTFSCHKDLSCFTQCCSDVNILLTPYDIIRLKKRLNLSSGELLERHTIRVTRENLGLPLVFLKMKDDKEKTCPFVCPDGCMIYEDRPWSCRSYPLQPQSSHDTDKQEGESYSLMKWPFCLGFHEKKMWTVREWELDQGLGIYKELEALFKELAAQKNLQDQEIVNGEMHYMFYNACYDIDRFRDYVFESRFFEDLNIDKETIETIKFDDVKLLKLCFEWLKSGLFHRRRFEEKT